jgi:hypothetical protein
MNRVLAALAGVLLTLVGASAVLAYQRATGGGQASLRRTHHVAPAPLLSTGTKSW